MIPGPGAGLPSMPDLNDVLRAHPAAVALVARGDRVEVGVAGSAARDSIFRVASLTKPPDDWMAALSRIPLLHQRVFVPLGMADTAFAVPPGKRGRFTSYYRAGSELVDAPDGQWSSEPAFPSGAGGLVSTVDDLFRFAAMLLDEGGDVLSPASVRQMTTDHLTPAQRDASELFLEGQGWGFGGSVDVAARDPWNVPGRYGWVGGTGTAAHVTPATGTVTVLLTQLELAGPTPPAIMRDVWTYAAGA